MGAMHVLLCRLTALADLVIVMMNQTVPESYTYNPGVATYRRAGA